MKKGKIIAAALVIASMLIGAGYAQWTDTLKIGNTVNTGNLNVEFVKTEGSCITFPNIFNLELNSNYVESNIDPTDKKTVTVTVNNLYPGSGVLYSAKFENLGTIPAKIKSVDVEFPQDNQLLKDNLFVVGGFIQMRPNNSGIPVPVRGGAGTFPTFWNGIAKGQYHLKDLEANLNDVLVGKVLKPHDYILLDIPEENKNDIANLLTNEGIEGFDPTTHNCVIMGLPKTNKDQNALQNQSIQFKIRLNFEQWK